MKAWTRAAKSTRLVRSVHSVMSSQSLRERKTLMRRAVQKELAGLSKEDIACQSASVTGRVLTLQQYRNAKSISIFLSMPGKETSTTDIVLDALRSGKEVFVPHIYSESDGTSKSMDMLQIADESDLRSLRPDSWGIPSLSKDSISNRRNALGGQGIEYGFGKGGPKRPTLDVIFVPAVAFDATRNRLGHGKGFYDRYLQRYHGIVDSTDSGMPVLVGLGLRQQLLSTNEIIPYGEDDWKVDLIVTSDSIL